MPEGGFFSFAETVPDRNREALAQAGPMISYKRPEERIIVESSVPVSPGSRRWPKAARPMETPAWGIDQMIGELEKARRQQRHGK